MNKTKGLFFTASLVLAITLTISCEDKEAKGKPAEAAAPPTEAAKAENSDKPSAEAPSAAAPKEGTFTDPRDGKKYKSVKIGEQVWMAENLNYDAKGSKCYDNKDENCAKYGRVYDKNTAGQGWMNKAGRACPEDWRLPYDDDVFGGGFSDTSDLGYWVRNLENDEIGVWYKGMIYKHKSKDLPSNTNGLFSVRCVQGS
jgi:hypothetical protein